LSSKKQAQCAKRTKPAVTLQQLSRSKAQKYHDKKNKSYKIMTFCITLNSELLQMHMSETLKT